MKTELELLQKPMIMFRTPFLLVLVGILFIALFYHSTLSVFHLRWSERSSAFSHGYLLFPLCLWLVSQEWRKYNPRLVIPWVPILLIACVSFLWFVGRVVTVEFVEQSAVILLCVLLVPAVIGYKNSFRILLPFLFLFTTVPIIETLFGDLLQISTAKVSGILLNIAGVRTFQDGYLLMIPAGSFVVEQSCSGIRYQIAAISLALIDAYMTRMTWRYFMMYVVAAILTAFIANSIRILIIVFVAQMTNMQTSLVNDHVWVGWVVFSILMPMMMWLWHKYVPFTTLIEPDTKNEFTVVAWWNKTKIIPLLLLLLALSFGPVLELFIKGNTGGREVPSRVPNLVSESSQWEVIPADKQYWSPKVMKPDASRMTRFVNNKSVSMEYVDVFSGYYSQQSNDREAINVVNKVFNTHAWSVVSKKKSKGTGVNGILVEEVLLRRNGADDRLVWRWYSVGGKLFGDPVRAKLYNFTSTLVGRPDITVHIIATDVLEDEKAASRLLRQFLAENKNMFSIWISKIRNEN